MIKRERFWLFYLFVWTLTIPAVLNNQCHSVNCEVINPELSRTFSIDILPDPKKPLKSGGLMDFIVTLDSLALPMCGIRIETIYLFENKRYARVDKHYSNIVGFGRYIIKRQYRLDPEVHGDALEEIRIYIYYSIAALSYSDDILLCSPVWRVEKDDEVED